MRVEINQSTPIVRSGRVMQLCGIFEVAETDRSTVSLSLDVPIEDRPWRIGLIVGPSGCGKSTVARRLFKPDVPRVWDPARSIVDSFPAELGIKDITGLLSSVGFSSPPSWLRPFHALSNGEQFRVTLARALAEPDPLICIDEFTSVVDRTVAQIGSSAVAKAVRRHPSKQLVAVSCHYDVIDWLQPDWILDPSTGVFTWRVVQRRPDIQLEIVRTDRSAWKLFEHHHYMSRDLHNAARCFVALIDGRPAAFASAIFFPHAVRPGWREHRTVCLPDFQGVGIGNRLSEFVGSLFRATGRPYFSATASPAMIGYRAKSPLWRMSSAPHLNIPHTGGLKAKRAGGRRVVAGFEYIGPARPEEARSYGLT